MKNVLIFGVSNNYKEKEKEIRKDSKILGFIDNYYSKKECEGLPVYRVSDISRVEYDEIIVCSMYFTEITNQLLEAGVSEKKINFSFNYEKKFIHEKLFERENYNIVIKNRELKFVGEGIVLNLENENNFLVAKETFLMHEYGYYSKEDDQYIVVDIGANIGDTALYFGKRDNVKKVYAYEPCEETFLQAKKNIEESDFSEKIELFKFGLGEKEEKLEIKYSNEMSGSISSKIDNSLTVAGKELKVIDIEIKKFKEEFLKIIEKKENEKIILKMDCEGAEFDIFESLIGEEEILKDVECIMLEWHFGDENNIVEFLKNVGYKVFCKRREYEFGMIYATR